MSNYLPIIISGIVVFTALMWWLLALGSVKKIETSNDVAPPKEVPAPPVAATAAPAAKLMDDPRPTAKTAPPKAQAPLKAAATKAAPTRAVKPAAPKTVTAKVVAPKAAPAVAPKIAAPTVKAAPAQKIAVKPKAAVKPAPKTAGPDNLELLKGVGPKVASLLKSMGVTSFDQVANWTPADVTEIDSKLGTFAGRIGRDNWIDQAKLLVAGDFAGFEKKYGSLGSEIQKG